MAFLIKADSQSWSHASVHEYVCVYVWCDGVCFVD